MTAPTQAQIEAALKAYNASTKSSYPANAMKAALTAAAEVEEYKYSQSQLDSAVKQTWSATIERCAQVAEDYDTEPTIGGIIADDIRELLKTG